MFKLVDGTIIYSRDIKRGAACWMLGKLKFQSPGEISHYIDDGDTAISDDAIETVLHLLKGGKKKEQKKESKDGNNGPGAA